MNKLDKFQTTMTVPAEGQNMTIMYVSAKPGDPSTLWRSPVSGKWYRNKKAAILDKGNPIDPDQIEIQHSWFERNPKTTACLIVACIAGVLYYLIRTKKILF